MKFIAEAFRRLPWVNASAGVLLVLLQRTPAVRTIVSVKDYVLASGAGELLRAGLTAAALGATHSLAGATFTMIQTPANPVRGTVGTPLSVAFTYDATPSLPQHFIVSGTLPPGMQYVPAASGGIVRSGTPAITGTPTAAGNYTVFVTGVGLAGQGTPEPIQFEITGGGGAAPAVTLHPIAFTAAPGSTAAFTVAATGTGNAYRWRRNGAAIADANDATLRLPGVTAAQAGDYSVVVTNTAGSATSNSARLSVENGEGRLANLSVRANLATSQRLIVGFATNGAKNVLLRGIGPTLASFNLEGAYADPRLELFSSSAAMIDQNDDWNGSLVGTFSAVGAFPLTLASKDAALQTLIDGAHSAHLVGPSSGVVLVEVYDSGSGTTPRLINVSARNIVGTDENILIAGFVVVGSVAKTLLIRAVGPRLASAPFGIEGTLVDPKLEIYNSAAVKVVENDNWTASVGTTFITVGAFDLIPNSRDAALLVTLPPGEYTAQVSGVSGGTGEALVEVYEVP